MFPVLLPLLLLFSADGVLSRHSSSSASADSSAFGIDCGFSSGPAGFCAWRPADSDQSARLWHSGNAVLVDSVNAVVRRAPAGGGDDRFAFVQGRFGAPTEGSLQSPLVVSSPAADGRQRMELRFEYWKASAAPAMDICVEEDRQAPQKCLDTIQGPGQEQWVRRAVEIRTNGMEKPFRVVLRARNMLAAEDIIAVDDIQLVRKTTAAAEVKSDEKRPKNPFEGMDEELEKEQKQRKTMKMAQTKIFAVERVGDGDEQLSSTDAVKAEMDGKGVIANRDVVAQPSPIRAQIRLAPPQHDSPDVAAADGLSAGSRSAFPPPSMSSSQIIADNQADHCRAVSCSFMGDHCLWELSPEWRNDSSTDGSLSVQSPVQHSQLTSAPFKAPLTASLDFDLWMSDGVGLTVAELLGGDEKRAEKGAAEVVLFTRRGATDGGWHRFRVPLRPSFSAVRLLIRALLDPPHSSSSFLSLSNVKLVNGDGDEVGCETVAGTGSGKEDGGSELRPLAEDAASLAPLAGDFFGGPAPLQLSASQFPFPLGPSSASPLSAPFNPLRPMFEGLLPIVPLRGNPLRLTALMDGPVKSVEQQQHSQFPGNSAQLSSPPPPHQLDEKSKAAEEKKAMSGGDEEKIAEEEAKGPPEGLLPFTVDGGKGKKEENDDEGRQRSGIALRRHQPSSVDVERIIRPASEDIAVPQLIVLPRRQKLTGKGETKAQKVEEGDGGGGEGWPTLEMGGGKWRKGGQTEDGEEGGKSARDGGNEQGFRRRMTKTRRR